MKRVSSKSHAGTEKTYNYVYQDRHGVHRVELGHGTLVMMESNHEQGDEKSFQRLCQHRVPKAGKHVRGGRLNWTIRIHNPNINVNRSRLMPQDTIDINENARLLVWNQLPEMTEDELCALHKELLDDMEAHGNADRTFVFGKWHENNGRKVLEQAMSDGQTYRYGGKTTDPGKAFGPHARKALERLAQMVGVQGTDAFWAHLVYYPDASCKLGWHSDAEDGINPHAIFSVTFLDDPVNGARPFDVRLTNRLTRPQGRVKRAKQ